MTIIIVILHLLAGAFSGGLCLSILQEHAGQYRWATYKTDLIFSRVLILFGFLSLLVLIVAIGKLHPDLKKIKWRLI
jgi:hypothetical protein